MTKPVAHNLVAHNLCKRAGEADARPVCTKHCGDVGCLGSSLALRSLRVWHYRHALLASKKQRDARATQHTLALARQAWAFHMGAVQALNDVLPTNDVDHDHRTMSQADEVLPFRVPA